MRGLREREIISILTRQFAGQPGVPLGFDEDVAAIPLSPRTWIILKTDMLVASTDVPPGMTVQETARKAVVATVSDFAAKGVQPKVLMVSLGLPAPANRQTIQDLARGLGQAVRAYSCKIVGGDTSQADDLVIGIAGVGFVNPKRLVRRSGARVGDIVAVTGQFGRTAAGLKILMSREDRNLERYRSLVNAVRHPRARLSEGILLAKSGGVTSSIDSSDGLAWSLHQLAQASRKDIIVDTIPVSADVRGFANQHRLSALELALYGGEEYELVVTVKPKMFPELKKQCPALRKIGTVKRGHGRVVADLGGKLIRVEERGWEHFA